MKFRGFESNKSYQIFEKIVENIRMAVGAGIPVKINTVVTKDNINNLFRMYDWLRDIGVAGWRIALPKATGAFQKNKEIFFPKLDTVFQEYLRIIKHHLSLTDPLNSNFRLQIEHFFRLDVFRNLDLLSPDDFTCDYDGKKQSCCIKPNGDVTPCAIFEKVVGNVYQDSFKDIWYSEPMQKIKNIKICDVTECQSCSYIPICGTGCRANAIFNNGSYESKDNDACLAMEFFTKKVVPILIENKINIPFL